MAKIARLSGRSDWIELDFVERERTPRQLMKLGIRHHLAGLSLSNTISELEKFGVERSRKAVHDWVQKVVASLARTRNWVEVGSAVVPDHSLPTARKCLITQGYAPQQ